MSKKISIDPDWLLEWLNDRGYVEKTESAFSSYRIATNPDTDRPYTITEIVQHLRRSRGNSSKSGHSRPFNRELKKCFNEYNISYMSLTDHALMCTEMRYDRLKEIEEKTGVNLDPLTPDERRKVSVNFSMAIRRVGREEALRRIALYVQRRLQNRGKDLRKGKVSRYQLPAPNVDLVSVAPRVVAPVSLSPSEQSDRHIS